MGIFYFITCCNFPNNIDNYFGIDYAPNQPLINGVTYKIVRNSDEICGRYYDGAVPNGVPIYADVTDVINYGNNCKICLDEVSCEKPKPIPLPKQPTPSNECNVITIFPMEIECVISNPTTPISSDGEMSVSITGGTPPYTIIWSNGNIAPAIQNLSVGVYTATVIDYYGDFTATTTCRLTSQYDCIFSGTVENEMVETATVYLVTITGGTSEGPYTIYYDKINESNIAINYSNDMPATNIELEELTSGYSVVVPEQTNVIYLNNDLCDIFEPYPVEPNKPIYDFCIIIDGDFAIHFNPNGMFGGYNTWISDDSQYQIIWDVLLNKWRVSGGTIPYQIVSNSQYPPLSGWYTIGGGAGNLISNEGECSLTEPLDFIVRFQNASCICDGGITFVPSGGVPPYLYSIDNGVTYSNSAVFNSLCSGTYSLVLIDGNSDTYTSTQVLINNQSPITYSVNITPVTTNVSNTPTQNTNQISATLNITPPLPIGTSITLDLNHINTFKTSPTPTQSTLVTNTVLTINGLSQGTPLYSSGSTITNNTIEGCQGLLIYNTTQTESWSNVTINSGDVVVFNTTTSVFKTLNKCTIGESSDTYTITNAIINGCSCCNVEVINLELGPSGGVGGVTT